MTVVSSTIGSNPFLKLLLKKISAKLGAITARNPKSSNAHTACSRDEPQPKFSLASKIVAVSYGDWFNICFATSKDGKTFERVIQPDGKTGVFTEGIGFNTRDAMLIQIAGLWHCYYTASPHDRGYAYCRTSSDLKTWS